MLGTLVIGLTALASAGVQIRVDGEGYLRAVKDGRVVYAKSARLVVQNQRLCDESGLAFLPTISIQKSGTLSVDLEGNVTCDGSVCGRLVLAILEGGADQKGFFAHSGRAKLGSPGEGTCGVIRMDGAETATKARSATTQSRSDVQPTSNSATSRGLVITVRPMSEVDGTSFTLGEIAAIEGQGTKPQELSSIRIGDTPVIGVERGIDRAQVVSKLKAAGVNTLEAVIIVPANAKVTRACQKIPHTFFVEAAMRESGTRMPNAISYKCERDQPEMSVPKGRLELRSESVSGNSNRLSVAVAVYVDGRRINSRTIVLVPDGQAQKFEAGSILAVRIISNGATVQTRGKLRRAAYVGQVAEVVTDQNVVLTGIVAIDGTIEVKP